MQGEFVVFFDIRDINKENKKDIYYKKLRYISHGLISVEID